MIAPMLCLLVAYLLGCITFGQIYYYCKTGRDIRSIGSGNVGATNIYRALGKKAALITFLVDFMKGYSVVLVLSQFYAQNISLAAGLATVCGHVFPFWMSFKGGKGVATALGVFCAASFPIGLFLIVVWAVVFAIFRYSSLASVFAMLLAVVLWQIEFGYTQRGFILFAIGVLVIARHFENCVRLMKGEEPRFSVKGRN